jgi:cysteine desulfurase
MIYLDNNATTPVRREVEAAIIECWREGPLNASSQHRGGRRAQRRLDDARERIAQLLGADSASTPGDRVIFTSGGTEANNLALLGLNAKAPGKVVISAIEHPSVGGAADELARRGVEVCTLRVHGNGVVDETHLRELLDKSPTRLVSVMLVNNETGAIQPIRRIAEQCAAAGVPLHTDAVQAVGKIAVDFCQLGVAAMTVSAHKLHGPQGIGALMVRGDASLQPMMFGAAQQLGMRAGTEPVALAVGMRRALELWHDEQAARAEHMVRLRNTLENAVLANVSGAVVIAQDALRAPHTSNLAFPGIDRQAALIALDLAGVACSTGSACASGSSEPSPVLLAMNCPDAWVRSSLRFSVSAMNTLDEIEEAARRISTVVKTLRRGK